MGYGIAQVSEVSLMLDDRLVSTLGDRRPKPDDRDADAAGDVERWRGPSEARWIVRLLNGAPPPREAAHSLDGLVPHG